MEAGDRQLRAVRADGRNKRRLREPPHAVTRLARWRSLPAESNAGAETGIVIGAAEARLKADIFRQTCCSSESEGILALEVSKSNTNRVSLAGRWRWEISHGG